MQIICTNKLLEEMKEKPAPPKETPALYTWWANLVKINRRKSVILMCEQNRYVVILYALKGKDFKNLDRLILDAVRNTLKKQRVNPKIIERYLSDSGPVSYVKNADRSRAAILTHVCRESSHTAWRLESVSEYNDTLGVHASERNFIGDFRTGDCYHPYEKMLEDLGAYGISPIFDTVRWS